MAWDARSIADALGWKWIEKRKEYAGLCPCHEPSGSHEFNAGVKDSDKGIVFKCFAGCTYAEFVAAMEARGLKREPQKREKTKPKEIERYAYTDETGNTLYYNIRFDPKDFRMAQPSTTGDGLKWSVKDLPRRVIYRLPEILESTHTIFFVEGEKDVHSLERLGVTATCIAGGADGWVKYAEHYIKQLAGQDIVIIPDNDEAGEKLARDVHDSMQQIAKRIRILHLPGLKDHGDVSDWIKDGGTLDELWALTGQIDTSKDTGIVEIEAVDLMQIQFKPIQWFASGLLHEGMVLFGGKSKRGKSWVALNAAISIATGGNVFGHYEVPGPVRVLFCALEDGPRRTQRRLRMIDPTADFSNIKFAFRMPPLDEGGIEYIARHIKEGFKVVIVDVLAHVEKSGRNGLRDYHEVYRTFAPLQALRSDYQFAIIMITHLRKQESEDVFSDLHGSVAYQGAQDALWVLERKQQEDTALLHLRDKDAEDKIAEIKFDGAGIWTFVGEGEEHAASRTENEVIKFLLEEKKPQSIKEIMLATGVRQENYAAFRQRLSRMCSKGLILRTDRGLYAALRDYDFDEI